LRLALGRPFGVVLPPGPPLRGLGYFVNSDQLTMQLCYVDESGKAATLTRARSEDQPVVVIAGISMPEAHLTKLTHEWIELKRTYLPDIVHHRSRPGWLDGILTEVKGTTLRRGFRSTATGRQRKQAIGLLDGMLRLLELHDCRILGRIWVKQLDVPIDGMAIHFSSLQFICGAFHAGLGDEERGMLVVDSQTYQHNHRLAHSVFTQRFASTPSYRRLLDLPVFAHSDNHAGLQVADLLCSGVLAPIACAVYGDQHTAWNRHCDVGFLEIRERYGGRLERLTYDWDNVQRKRESPSVVVHDPHTSRPTRLTWRADQGSRSTGETTMRALLESGATWESVEVGESPAVERRY
jgi:hypothetical protein